MNQQPDHHNRRGRIVSDWTILGLCGVLGAVGGVIANIGGHAMYVPFVFAACTAGGAFIGLVVCVVRSIAYLIFGIPMDASAARISPRALEPVPGAGKTGKADWEAQRRSDGN